MTSSVWLGLLGSGTAGAVLIAIINAVIGRRKLGADVTKIATDAAGGVIERLEAENVRLSRRNDALEEDVILVHEQIHEMRRQRERDEQLRQARDRSWREVLQVHAAWDQLAITMMGDCTPPMELPAAPPLTPPTLPFLPDLDAQE